jgi:hypothetical protein
MMIPISPIVTFPASFMGKGQGQDFTAVAKNRVRFITAHLVGLPFPSRKRQTHQVRIMHNFIIESEHIDDIVYKTHPLYHGIRMAQKKVSGLRSTFPGK